MRQEDICLHKSFQQELTERILPYWIQFTPDLENGGFYGEITNENQVTKTADKSVVICTRILWTFSAAYRRWKKEEYMEMACRACGYLLNHFWDQEYGGVFWMVDYQGRPVNQKKQIYAQAFAIYGLSEYAMAAGKKEALERAMELYALIEAHSYDDGEEGYLEAFSRSWGEISDPRLLPDDLAAEKTMNTHLHLLEAYGNLLKALGEKDIRLEKSLSRLVQVFMERFIDPETGHFHMYFDRHWKNLSPRISYGHDIEGSWLLWEAASILGDEGLAAKIREISLRMAEAVLRDGFDGSGGLLYEEEPGGYRDGDRVWWAQAEGVVGFYQAYQLSGRAEYQKASLDLWGYIRRFVLDQENGEWFRRVRADGSPRKDRLKIDGWKCPYHNSRMCFEMMERVSEGTQITDGGNII